MGADHPPDVLLERIGDLPHDLLELTLVGPSGLARTARSLSAAHLATDAFVAPTDSLHTAMRRTPNSSMRLALQLLRDGRTDAVVSAGNTAALMALSRQLVPRAPGLSRPAICKMLNGKTQPLWMLDLGANIGSSAAQLGQFAVLGAALASGSGTLPASQRVRVGLLNIGAEVTKGPAVLAEAASLLADDQRFNYVGFVEAHELFDGRADVIVSDGLLGNTALKAMEGTASMAQHLLVTHLQRLRNRGGLRAWLLERLLASRDLADVYDPQGYNGASLLGLSGVVIKSHGRADGKGYAAAVMQAQQEFTAGVPRRVFDAFVSSSG